MRDVHQEELPELLQSVAGYVLQPVTRRAQKKGTEVLQLSYDAGAKAGERHLRVKELVLSSRSLDSTGSYTLDEQD